MAGSRGKVLGDASARQCGRQQSQALCKVVVRVFWRDLAHIRLTFRPALLPPPPPPVHLPRLCPLSAPGFRTSLLRLCGRKRPCDMRPLGRAKAPYEATADQSEKLQEEVGCHRCKFGWQRQVCESTRLNELKLGDLFAFVSYFLDRSTPCVQQKPLWPRKFKTYNSSWQRPAQTIQIPLEETMRCAWELCFTMSRKNFGVKCNPAKHGNWRLSVLLPQTKGHWKSHSSWSVSRKRWEWWWVMPCLREYSQYNPQFCWILLASFSCVFTIVLNGFLTDCSPHLCVRVLFLVVHFRLPLPVRPPAARPTHNLSPHNFLTHNLSTHNLLTPNLSPHNFLTHNLLTHNFLTHNLFTQTCSHKLPHTQLDHTQLTHTQLAHTQRRTCSPNTQLVTTQLPHTQLVHIQLTHTNFLTHNLTTHNLLTHSLPTHNLLTTQLRTCSPNTQLVTTQLPHTQLAHTQLTHTQLVTTQLPHTQLLTTSHTTWPHTTYSHTAGSHTTCHHTTSYLLTYTTCPLGDIHLRFAWQPDTQLVHTQLDHTQLTHTQLAHTQLLTTQLRTCSLTQLVHLVTSTFVLRGSRGTYSTGLALVARLVPSWRSDVAVATCVPERP